MRSISAALLAASALTLLVACDNKPQEKDLAAMEAASGAYKTCAACHGAEGQGNAALNAPALVNLDGWYMKRQLQNFRDGVRGRNPQDSHGMIMAAQSALLVDDAAIDAVVRQIESFPDIAPASTLRNEQGNGQQTYEMICGACHGVQGNGNENLNAPALRGIDDWYLVRQFENFRKGVRGIHESDLYGQQMQRMGHVITEEEVLMVTAWLSSQGINE